MSTPSSSSFTGAGSPLPAASYSHWLAGLYGDDQPIPTREPLRGPITVDVAIVGAGYTGLWTAYELLRSQPDLKIAILEKNFAGYGASGRNGGAAIAQLNGHPGLWNSLGGPDGAVRMERAVQDGVDQIGAAVEREGIDCKFSKNGFLNVARNQLEKSAILESIEVDRRNGFDESDTVWLDREQTAERLLVDNMVGAKFNSHCASFDPGRLVRGLAETVERLGATIYEQTPVTRIAPRQAHTERGLVTATYVLRATEAYTASLEGQRRKFVPIHTSMISTEPIPQELWDEIGWAKRETVLAEHRFLHLQHTSDGRITIGGDDNRVPYRFGSKGSRDEAIRDNLRQQYHEALIKLFPPLRDVKVARTWSGVFAVARDWAPSVGLDRSTGLGWAGGYVGEGVVASNMAGRTMRDLVLGEETEMSTLPWVRSHPRNWEPEPLRFMASGVIWGARVIGEAKETRTDKHSHLAAAAVKLAGFKGRLG